MLIKNIRYVVTQNTCRDILEDCDILLEGNTIKAIGNNLEGSPVLDGSSFIAIPGLINGHTHNTMTSLRGICDDEELEVWLARVVKAELAMSEEEKRISSQKGVKEMLRTGTTMFCDMYVDILPTLRVAMESGIRAILFKSYFDAFEGKGFDADEIKHLQKEVVSSCGRVIIGLGPHSLYGCSKKILSDIHTYSKKHGLLKQIHLAETRKERYDIYEKEHCLPLEYLNREGFVDERTSIVHNVWLTKGELDTVKRCRATMVHCPTSNMKLAGGGVMPLIEAQERGIACSLGTDSAVSNNSLDMFCEMKVAALLHKHHRWDSTAAPAQLIFDLATIQGAQAFHIDGEVGSLEKGKKADIVLLDMTSENLSSTTKENILSNLVYTACGYNVDTVIVDGKIKVRKKQVLV